MMVIVRQSTGKKQANEQTNTCFSSKFSNFSTYEIWVMYRQTRDCKGPFADWQGRSQNCCEVFCQTSHRSDAWKGKKKHRLCTEKCKEDLDGCQQNVQGFVIPFSKGLNSIYVLLLIYTVLMLAMCSSVWYKNTFQVYLLFLRITH